jgi:hypothetical protein
MGKLNIRNNCEIATAFPLSSVCHELALLQVVFLVCSPRYYEYSNLT